MSATVTSAARALAIGFVLAVAGSPPAWSQSLIGDGLPASQDPYAGSYQGHRGAQWYPAPYGGAYTAPYAYVPGERTHRR